MADPGWASVDDDLLLTTIREHLHFKSLFCWWRRGVYI